MASFFGEVLDVSSRAVDEEEEKDVTIQELYLENQCNLKDCDLFIFSIGTNASIFSEIFLIPSDAELVTNVKNQCHKNSDDCDQVLGLNYKKSPEIIGSLYRKSSVLYFVCRPVLSEQAIPLVNHLLDLTEQQQLSVVILSSRYITEYKSPHSEVSFAPFLRYLKSSKYTTKCTICPLLEIPNTVTGLEAAILTECEVKGIPAILIICYTDQYVDYDSVKLFTAVSSIQQIQNILPFNANADKQLQKRLQKLTDSTNLYT